MKRSWAYILLLLFNANLWAQENPWEVEFNGYLKYLASQGNINASFLQGPGLAGLSTQSFDQQLHNRFNVRIYKGSWSIGLGMRNRLFNGSQLEQGELFFDALDSDPGLVDLSLLYWRDDQVVLHTIFDRLWFQFESEKWLVRAGRQRINWGINSIWNPNDIMNQYNFFDFDYEERPGTDALRIQYFSSFSSSWELAVAPAEELEQSTAALLYRNNRFTYDWQALIAYYQENISLGGGWAGNIDQVGFKGELNYYWPLVDQEEQALVLSSALDYVLNNGLYLSLSYLYNGSTSVNSDLGDFNSFNPGVVLSPKNPFPFRHTMALSANYAFNPIFNGSVSFMYDPADHNLIFFPSLTYGLSRNLDALLAWQLFMSQNPFEEERLQWFSQGVFARLKWSF